MELVNVTEEDYELLYQLLGERPIAANISHSELPPWVDHVKFCASEPYWKWYIIMAGDVRTGSCYITHNNEIGIAILDEYKRMGMGVSALKLLIDTHIPLLKENSVKVGSFIANINPDNHASKALFQGFGFKKVQETYRL